MRLYLFFIFTIIFLLACQPGEGNLNTTAETDLVSNTDIEVGQAHFKKLCARCHGINAEGGTGPSLKRAELIHAPDDEALISIIQFGIPGTEMPGTWLLSPKEARQVAAYIRSIGKAETEVLTGNPEAGRKIYETKGACSTCHIINGEGGSLGPELTKVGSRRGISYLTQTLLEPGFAKNEDHPAKSASGFIEHLIYRVVTREGKEITGMRVSEDAFTIQLKDAGNNYYSFKKSELKEMEKEFGKSLMPSMKDILSEEEMDDLVAYLAGLKG